MFHRFLRLRVQHQRLSNHRHQHPAPNKWGKTHLGSGSAHVRQQHDLRVLDQARMDLRFMLVDVEAAGEDFARGEGLHEGVFVHDGAAGGVDDDDAGFHEGELIVGDDVVG